MPANPVSILSDRELVDAVNHAAAHERRSRAALITLLAELDGRKLYLAAGCASSFAYCTRVLHLSEHAAYGRIAAARASRRYPRVIDLLASGDITLTTVVLLAPHLTAENAEDLLDAARHKTKEEVERLIACVHPQPDIASSVRRLAASKRERATEALLLEAPSPGAHEQADQPATALRAETANVRSDSQRPAARPRPTIAPLSSERYLIKVTVGRETHEKLRRAQDLLRHTIPNGDPAAIIDRALAVLVEQLERTKLAKVHTPRRGRAPANTRTRCVPASVRRAVWQRDGGRCAFVGSNGRCDETAFLEFHHMQPFAEGGPTTAANLSLRCRAHNAHEARVFFGEAAEGIGEPTRSGPS